MAYKITIRRCDNGNGRPPPLKVDGEDVRNVAWEDVEMLSSRHILSIMLSPLKIHITHSNLFLDMFRLGA